MKLLLGDCVDVMREMEENSIDSIVTDPPYGLKFMGKEFDNLGDGEAQQKWHLKWTKEALRVLKPGGHLIAFGGTRTYHRLACAVEDAGFEVRDMIHWMYGSGFPKSQNISKAIDKTLGAERTVVGQVKRWGANASGGRGNQNANEYQASEKGAIKYDDVTEPTTDEAKKWDGFGTAIKPAHEPAIMARKQLSEKTIAKNVLKHGTGGLNIDGCRIEGVKPSVPQPKGNTGEIYGFKNGKGRSGEMSDNSKGRWPANVILDGSKEVLELFPETKSGKYEPHHMKHVGNKNVYGKDNRVGKEDGRAFGGDSGSAARFFYCAKVSKKERGEGNNHPTVKPIALMRHLIKLVTPPNGTVLDPFMGSGSTGKACQEEGFDFIGIEKDEDYFEIAKKRISSGQMVLKLGGK